MRKYHHAVSADGLFQQAKRTRQRLASGEVLWGTFLAELESSGVIPVLAHAGLDFVLVDMEHGTYSLPQARRLIEASRAVHNMTCLVRVPLGERGTVTKMLDAGADGILFPQARTMDEVRQAVIMTKYPPLGSRGVHLLRPHTGFAFQANARQVFAEANASIITGIQIETPEVVKLADEIAATEGVDMLYVGPGDLGAIVQSGGGCRDSAIAEAMDWVGRACHKHGKIAACHVESVEAVDKWLSLGFRFFGVCVDVTLLFNGARTIVSQARRATKLMSGDRHCRATGFEPVTFGSGGESSPIRPE